MKQLLLRAAYLSLILSVTQLLAVEVTSAQFVRNNIEYNMRSYTLDEDSVDLISPYFEVQRFDWLNVFLIDEEYEGYFYPDTSTYHQPNKYGVLPGNFAYGHFNSDDLQDFTINWGVSPHTLIRESLLTIDIFINDGNNGFELFTDFTNDQLLAHNLYRLGVGRFNDDSLDDITSASGGVAVMQNDGIIVDYLEPFPVLISNEDGTYREASHEVEGQENGSAILSAHDLSIGDINGDGFDDIYQGTKLFFSNGDGSFLNATDRLPDQFVEASEVQGIMSSTIEDFNNDGFADIVVLFTECGIAYDCLNKPSGYVLMSQNNSGSLENRVLQELPVGRHGKENTKFNYTVAYDVNLDGWLDIVSGITRRFPYYVGSHLQIFVNQQGEGFLDQTDQYVSFPKDAETLGGGGIIYVLDINDDGVDDILHSKGDGGFRAYLHDGQKLQLVDHTWFPFVLPYHFTDDTKPKDLYPVLHSRAFPVNIDGQGAVDYVANVAAGQNSQLSDGSPASSSVEIFYSVIAKKPLRVRAPEEPMILIDGAVADTVLPGNYFRVGWQPQEIVDAVTIQWSTDPMFESSVDSVVVMDTSLTYIEDLSTNTQYFWRLRGWNNMGSTSWTEVKSFTTGVLTSSESENIPSSFSLRQNYPNPFNPVTQIEFEVPATAEIRLEVFDVLGRSVRVLADGLYGAGAHSVSFDASDLPSGLYMYRLTSADYVQTRSMQLVK